MSYEDRMDAANDYAAEQQGIGYDEGFQQAKTIILEEVFKISIFSSKLGKYIIHRNELIEIIQELEAD